MTDPVAAQAVGGAISYMVASEPSLSVPVALVRIIEQAAHDLAGFGRDLQ